MRFFDECVKCAGKVNKREFLFKRIFRITITNTFNTDFIYVDILENF